MHFTSNESILTDYSSDRPFLALVERRRRRTVTSKSACIGAGMTTAVRTRAAARKGSPALGASHHRSRKRRPGLRGTPARGQKAACEPGPAACPCAPAGQRGMPRPSPSPIEPACGRRSLAWARRPGAGSRVRRLGSEAASHSAECGCGCLAALLALCPGTGKRPPEFSPEFPSGVSESAGSESADKAGMWDGPTGRSRTPSRTASRCRAGGPATQGRWRRFAIPPGATLPGPARGFYTQVSAASCPPARAPDGRRGIGAGGPRPPPARPPALRVMTSGRDSRLRPPTPRPSRPGSRASATLGQTRAACLGRCGWGSGGTAGTGFGSIALR